jgi:GMP synthase-glutamine amidotransferase domain-like protein
MGANDGADYPWIEPLSQLVREAYAHAMPVFGICLGSQLSARALGGQVASPAPGQGESGLASVFLTEAGQEDEAIAEMFAQGDAASARADVATNEGSQLPVPVNHNDAVVALPPQAKLLASSKACPIEAWRLGSVLGLQWHPEVVPERLYLWAKENGAQAGLDEAEIKRQADDVLAQGRRIDAITCAMGRTAARMLLRKARAYRVLQSVVD